MTSTIERLAELAKGATRGPWHELPRFPKSFDDHGYRIVAARGEQSKTAVYAERDNMTVEDRGCVWGNDMAFIAECNPAAITRAHAEYQELERRNAELVEALDFANKRLTRYATLTKGVKKYYVSDTAKAIEMARAALAHSAQEKAAAIGAHMKGVEGD